MTRRKLNEVVRYLRRLAAPQGDVGLSDAELLERYVRCRDEAAFELLLWRHGDMVFNVCRRILSRQQDAEDAFQATFLAFVRKAPSIAHGASVASWLYKVAYRVALEAKKRARKTALHEKPGGEVLAVQPSSDPIWDDVRPILDEELNRLPERLRRPFVLCYLEGKTNEEAARLLGCRPGTIFSRLSRGRELLRKRLTRRGVTLTAAMLTATLARHAAAAMPSPLLRSAALRMALSYAGGSASGAVSIQVATLAEGVLRTMFITKLKIAALMLLIAGMFAGGGVLTQHVLNAAPKPEAGKETSPEPPKDNRKDGEKKPVVAVLRPKRGGLERISDFTGHVRASAQQQVYSAVSGRVKRYLVDIGDAVKRGDVLLEIEAPLLVKDAEQATAALQLAKGKYRETKVHVGTAEAERKAASSHVKEYEGKMASKKAVLDRCDSEVNRLQREVKRGVVDPQVLRGSQLELESARAVFTASVHAVDSARSAAAVKKSLIDSAKAATESAEASVRIAQIALDKARLKVNFTRIRALFDGVIASRNVNTGDFVSASDSGVRQPLMTVLQIDPMRVVVSAAENDVPYIRLGAPVELRIGSQPDVKLPICKVSRTGYSIDEATGTLPVEIDVADKKNFNLLRPGMFISAAIHLNKKSPANAVVLPASCFVPGEPYSVYVVRDGKAHLTRLKVSYHHGKNVEIVSGVQAKDNIVADPHNLYGEVVPVEVKTTP